MSQGLHLIGAPIHVLIKFGGTWSEPFNARRHPKITQ
jgi:hypothetical protein